MAHIMLYEVVESNAHDENSYVGCMPLISISRIYKLRLEAERRIVRECRNDGRCTLHLNNENLFRLMDRVIIKEAEQVLTGPADALEKLTR